MANKPLHSKPKHLVSRRDFLRIVGLFSLDVFLGAIVGWNYIDKVEPDWVVVTNVSLKLRRIPKSFSGFKMVQLSDIHAGYWMTPERFKNIIEIVNEQSPDLVAITGDFILKYGGLQDNKPVLENHADIYKGLTDKYSTVAVLGNHDHWYDALRVVDFLEECGVRILINSFISIERQGELFHIAGVDDVYEGKDDIDAIIAKLPEDGGAILLSHEPDFADESAATGRFDLQISGHSHGGQVNIPLFGPLVLPYLGKKYHTGLYKIGDMYQYTNRGVGMSIPSVRFNCRPEITVFTLEPI